MRGKMLKSRLIQAFHKWNIRLQSMKAFDKDKTEVQLWESVIIIMIINMIMKQEFPNSQH